MATSSLRLYMINTSWRTLKCTNPMFKSRYLLPASVRKKSCMISRNADGFERSGPRRNLGVRLVLFVWCRSLKASCLHGKASEVSAPLCHTLHQSDKPHARFHLISSRCTYLCAEPEWWHFAHPDFTVLLDSPVQGGLGREWRACFH